jgi:selenophosphate synthase
MPKTQMQSVTVSGTLGELLKKEQIEKLKKGNEETKKDYQLWNLYDNKLIETVHFTPKWLSIGERETVKIVKRKN